MKVHQQIYLAGPMSNKPAYNHFEFDKATRSLLQMGHTVTTPFDTNSIVWMRHYGRPFDPYSDKCEYGDPILTEMMDEDYLALLKADVVVLLDGWRHSKGSRVEVLLAYHAGKPIYDARFQKLDLVPVLTIEGGPV